MHVVLHCFITTGRRSLTFLSGALNTQKIMPITRRSTRISASTSAPIHGLTSADEQGTPIPTVSNAVKATKTDIRRQKSNTTLTDLASSGGDAGSRRSSRVLPVASKRETSRTSSPFTELYSSEEEYKNAVTTKYKGGDDSANSVSRKKRPEQTGARNELAGTSTITSKARKGRSNAKSCPDTSDFLPRNRANLWKIGAHVSAAGGVENSILNAAMIGANAFALFVKSQRKWTGPPLTEESITLFKQRMREYGYDSKMVLPHGNYLVNLGNPDSDKREKSYECFVDDIKRCDALGLQLYNFHPGSTVGEATVEESLAFIAECINRAHEETSNVIIVLENMAGAGNVIGSEFAHLGSIINQVKDKTRVGVCIDTCHAFAAGYDIRTPDGWNATMTKFDDFVGLKYLRGMHINDSKAEYNTKRDRHQNIGLGHLGLSAFQHILQDPRTQGIPLILETPSFEQPREVWGAEIKVLDSISGHLDTGMKKEDTLEGPAMEDGVTATTSDQTLLSYVEELRNAVQGAEKATNQKTAQRSTKRKSNVLKEENEGFDDGRVKARKTTKRKKKAT